MVCARLPGYYGALPLVPSIKPSGARPMKVAVVGAGAVGGHMAARLAHAGVEVSVLARGKNLEAIQRTGITLVGTDERFVAPVHASDRAEDLGPQDIVITTLKAYGLAQAGPLISPLLGGDTPVVYAVNGLPWWYFEGTGREDLAPLLTRLDPSRALHDEVGVHRALGCVITSSNTLVAPGVVENSTPENSFVIGEPSGALTPRLEHVIGVLSAGLPGAQATQTIRQTIWNKLLVNIPSSLLCCLTFSRGADLTDDPAMADLFTRLGQEGAAVARALGVDADPDSAVRLAR
ncbi:MAG: 2-dehydropantoate 2-reductase, partial [Comamonadaceae bacterium]